MRNFLHFFLMLFVFFIFEGCSLKSTRSYSQNVDKIFPMKSAFKARENRNYEKVYEALKLQYKNWKGVKYKYGGSSKSGVDCSAFVQRTFKDRLNIGLPRTTALQSSIGENVLRENLKMGDLVFFKTGYKVRHVGIYLEGGKFLHASTKRGVTISRLDNSYYSKHFWKIKRVIN